MSLRSPISALLLIAVVLASACASHIRVARTTPQTDVAVLESGDPGLAGALAALRLKPTAEAHRLVAVEFVRLGVLDQAFDHLSIAIQKDSKNAAAYDERARVWREWNMPRRALDDINKAVQLNPKSAVFQNTLGTVLHALGVESDAEAAFLRAVQLDPTAAYAVNNLCYLAFVQGDTDKAVANCQLALQMSPELDAARQNLALAYAAKDIGRAEAQLLANGDTGRARYNLGILRMARGEFAEAAAAFDIACAARPAVRDACARATDAHARAKLR